MEIPQRSLIQCIFLLVFLTLGKWTFAQGNLSRTVSIDVKQQSLANVLDLLSKKGNFYFSYNSNSIPKDSLVTFSASSNSIKEVLDTLLNGNFDYQEAPHYIILRPAPYRLSLIAENVSEKDEVYTISGYVLDAQTGAKIPNASVYEKRLLISTLTNEDGFFKFKVKSSDSTIALTVTKEFYQEITVVVLSSVTVLPQGAGTNYGYDPADNSSQVERTAFGRFFVSSRQKIQSLNLRGFFVKSPFQASLTPGLSSHGMMSSQVINKFSLNLVGGYTAGVNGVEWAGVFNINKKSVQYVQAAGVLNIVGGSVKGVQMSGFSNTVLDSVSGVQLAGVYNAAKTNLAGMQASGLFNRVDSNVKGVQLTGLFNIVSGHIKGLQAAGLFNQVSDRMDGVQLAGGGNFSRRETNGLQMAGVINIASQDVRGVQAVGVGNISKGQTKGIQLAGLFNYAKNLKGVQIGVVNIADSSSGISIGIFNFIRGGYRKVSVSANEVMNTNIAFKTGNAKLYSILMGGINISDSAKVYAFGFGFGHDFILNKRLSISTELTSQTLYLGNWEQANSLQRARANLNVMLAKGFSIFVGPAFNVYTNEPQLSGKGYKKIVPSDRYPLLTNSKSVKGWLGWEAGITLF